MKIGTTRPYPPTGLTTKRWREIRPTIVRFAELTTTQGGVFLKALLDGERLPFAGDIIPHVVAYNGCLYLEDGHTRVARAILRGQVWEFMRVHYVDPEEAA